jgi:hypothetical protein
MKTNKDIVWERNFSADGPITIPAGAPVERGTGRTEGMFFVKPEFFKDNGVLFHDAAYYGCRVTIEDVEGI